MNIKHKFQDCFQTELNLNRASIEAKQTTNVQLGTQKKNLNRNNQDKNTCRKKPEGVR